MAAVERLDGDNGLLVAPHIDHLYDRGWISLRDDGTLLLSLVLNPSIVQAWYLADRQRRPPLRPEQSKYVAYHCERNTQGGADVRSSAAIPSGPSLK